MDLALLLPIEGQEGITANHMAGCEGRILITIGDLLDAFCQGEQRLVLCLHKYLPFGATQEVVQFPFGV